MTKQKDRGEFWYLSVFMIILFFTLLCVYINSITPAVQGDGHEYILQTVAFQNHFTFGINKKDLDMAKKQFYKNQETLQAVFDNVVHDNRGNAYSFHYGAYAALVTPIKLLLLKMNIYPLWAFSITNYLLWLAAVLVIFFYLKADGKEKFSILILIMFNPAFFYLDWVHTEIYIFSFEVIGLVFLYNKQYALSILALSISSMQNLGVLPLAMVAGVAYILNCIEEYRKEQTKHTISDFIKGYWKRIIVYGIFYLPGFFPIIMTYIRFGTYNLVAKAAMEDKYLVHKAFDYIFDLNIGVFPYEPILLLFFIIFLVIGIKRRQKTAILNLLGILGVLYIIAHQVQINSGMQEIMRYCIWIIPILIFFVVSNFNLLQADKQGIVLVTVTSIQTVFTALLISYCVWWGGDYNNGQFAPWTKLILDKVPQIYNPTHGIFYSRTNGAELYYSSVPAVYYNEEGYIRKIMLSKEAEEVFYSDDYLLTDAGGNVLSKKELCSYTIDEGDYKYINFTGSVHYAHSYSLGENILFGTEKYNADNYVQSGLSGNEGWGSWTDGKELTMSFCVNTDCPVINGSIDVGGTFYQPQRVAILINEQKVYEEVIEGKHKISFSFLNPKTHIVQMRMLLPDAVGPSEIMNSEDGRILGLSLISMKFEKKEYNISALRENGEIWFYSDEYNANKYVLNGISHKENGFSWTDGHQMDVLFALVELQGKSLSVRMNLCGVFNRKQRIKIIANNEKVFETTLDADEQIIKFKINIKDEICNLHFELPDAISPQELKMSDDYRELGLMIQKITISESR